MVATARAEDTALLTKAQRRSLAFLRWMIAACILLPLTLFVYEGFVSNYAVQASADLEIARTRDIAREQAVKVFETIERSLSEVSEIVRGSGDPELRADPRLAYDKLARIDRALPQLKSVWVIDETGRAVATSLAFPAPDASFADRDYFASHLERDVGVFVGPLLEPRPPFGGPPFFSISRRRVSPDGRFNGVLQASILPEYFERFYKQIGFEQGAFIVLALADGTVLASHPALPINAKVWGTGPVGSRIAQMPDAGLFTASLRTDGVERRIAYQKLDGYPVYVAASLTTDAIRRRWWNAFEGLIFVGVPSTLLLLTLLLFFLQSTKRLYIEAASRERAEAALRDNQRLEALGQLTGGVAHDFNNLLTVIGSSADLLRRTSLTEERRLRYIDAISETVRRATKLTAQLLAFARRQPLRPEVFNATQCVEGMAGVLGTLLGSSIDLRIAAAKEPCVVEADVSQFETAVINLVANARDAMPDGGMTSLSVNVVTEIPARLGGTPARHGYVAVAVTDTGTGIAPEQMARVFEPFFTTKEIGRGTGLGLSQVFGFARQSQGEVTVDSVPGAGATFTIYLPRSLADPPRLANAAPQSPAPATLRVLLVDDNEDVLQATGEALRARGMVVGTAANAEAALRRLDNAGSAFDVVLTDIVMPGMSGIAFARQLRLTHPHLPVLVTTGYSETVERDGAGDLPLIRKPYSLDDLTARLATLAYAGTKARERV